MKPTVLSLFSGIGGFDLGLERAGFEITGQVEIDPFCQRVLAAHWPEVPRYGDVRDISRKHGREPSGESCGSSVAERGEPQLPVRLDLICGGFPCQDLSVAGKRAGLAGERSGLWFEFHRILSELRPAYALIENVPGLLSSNNGRDFGIILAGLGQLWPAIGWAVLDSRHFGVPQRRRRVYVIAGPSRERVQQILSLCESGDWHPQKGREAREGTTDTLGTSADRVSGAQGPLAAEFLAKPLGSSATSFGGQRFDLDNETYVPETAYSLTRRNAQDRPESQAATLIAHSLSADGFDASEDGSGRGTPLVVGTLSANDGAPRQGQSAAAGHLIAVRTANTGSNGWGVNEDETAYTLDGANGQAVAFQQNTRDEVRLMGGDGHYAGALSAEPGMKQQNYIAGGASVRRLTPVECERLQGFPDGWTDVGNAADGPRYRALGNAVTVPVIEYLGKRLLEVLT